MDVMLLILLKVLLMIGVVECHALPQPVAHNDSVTSQDDTVAGIRLPSAAPPPPLVRLASPVKQVDIKGYNGVFKYLSYVEALPGGGALVTNFIGTTNTKQVIEVNSLGAVVHNLYSCTVCPWITGLLVLGNNAFVLHSDGKIVRIDLTSQNIMNTYRVDVGGLLQAGHMATGSNHDPDVLLLADYKRGEIFTFRPSTQEKKVRVTGLRWPTSVSYGSLIDDVAYIVCERGTSSIKTYNAAWQLLNTTGGYGKGDGQLRRPNAAFVTPEGTIIVSDTRNNRVSEFTTRGQFVRHVINNIRHPWALSFAFPYLWMTYDSRGIYSVRKYKIFQQLLPASTLVPTTKQARIFGREHQYVITLGVTKIPTKPPSPKPSEPSTTSVVPGHVTSHSNVERTVVKYETIHQENILTTTTHVTGTNDKIDVAEKSTRTNGTQSGNSDPQQFGPTTDYEIDRAKEMKTSLFEGEDETSHVTEIPKQQTHETVDDGLNDVTEQPMEKTHETIDDTITDVTDLPTQKTNFEANYSESVEISTTTAMFEETTGTVFEAQTHTNNSPTVQSKFTFDSELQANKSITVSMGEDVTMADENAEITTPLPLETPLTSKVMEHTDVYPTGNTLSKTSQENSEGERDEQSAKPTIQTRQITVYRDSEAEIVPATKDMIQNTKSATTNENDTDNGEHRRRDTSTIKKLDAPTTPATVNQELLTESPSEVPNYSTRRPNLTEAPKEFTTEYEPEQGMTTSKAHYPHSLDPRVYHHDTIQVSTKVDEVDTTTSKNNLMVLISTTPATDVSINSDVHKVSSEDGDTSAAEVNQTSKEIVKPSEGNNKSFTEHIIFGTDLTSVSEPVVDVHTLTSLVTETTNGDLNPGVTEKEDRSTKVETEKIVISSTGQTAAPNRRVEAETTSRSEITTVQTEYFIETGVTYEENKSSIVPTKTSEEPPGRVTPEQSQTVSTHQESTTPGPSNTDSSKVKTQSTRNATQTPINSTTPVRLQTPVMDLDLHSKNSELAALYYVAALPGGQAIVANYISKNNTDQIALVDNQGRTMINLYMCKGCGGITGLLVIKLSLYILHTNGKIIQIVLPSGPLLRTYQVDVGYMMHTGCLSAKELNISDLLVLADYERGEVFTYTLSSGVKSVKVTGLQTPISVAYLPSVNGTNYVVCDSVESIVNIYDENWSLLRQFGGRGRGNGEMLHPSSAITTPDGTVLVADYYNNRVSEFDASGRFMRNLLTMRMDRIQKPFALSFSYPYLWVGYYAGGNNIKRFKLYQS